MNVAFRWERQSETSLTRGLDELGDGPLGSLLDRLTNRREIDRIVWVPDNPLHGLPIHALRLRGQYLIERVEVAYSFSGAWIVHRGRATGRRRWGWPLVVAESEEVLPCAMKEGKGVAASFRRSRFLPSDAANPDAVRRGLRSAQVAHFACHAYFDPESPQNALIRLPTGDHWRSIGWMEEPFDDLRLLTLSACRSAQVSRLVGTEVFGLVTAAFAAGVRNVVAGLWSVLDEETAPLMWRFYRHRMLHDPVRALSLMQREAIARDGTWPLDWAVFACFASDLAPEVGAGLFRWLNARRQDRHAREFP